MILSTIKAIAESLTSPVTFFYGTNFEANLAADDFNGKLFPLIVFEDQFTLTDTYNQAGVATTSVPLTLLFLDNEPEKTGYDTNAFQSEPIILRMIALARKFVLTLQQNEIMSPTENIENATFTRVRHYYDTSMSGCMLQVTAPLNMTIDYCVDDVTVNECL